MKKQDKNILFYSNLCFDFHFPILYIMFSSVSDRRESILTEMDNMKVAKPITAEFYHLNSLIPEKRIPNICVGVWDHARGLVELRISKGKLAQNLGVSIQSKKFLFLEEAVFLVERGALDLLIESISLLPVSLDTAIAFFTHISCDFPKLLGSCWITPEKVLEMYKAYAYLRKMGLIILRSQLFLFSPENKTQISNKLQDAWGCRPIFYCWYPREAFSRSKNVTIPDFVAQIFSVHEPTPTYLEQCAFRTEYPCPTRLLLVDSSSVIVVELKDIQLPNVNVGIEVADQGKISGGKRKGLEIILRNGKKNSIYKFG